MGRRKQSLYYQYRYGLTQTVMLGGERFTCVEVIGSSFPGRNAIAKKTANKIRAEGRKARIIKDSNGYLYVLRGPYKKRRKRS